VRIYEGKRVLTPSGVGTVVHLKQENDEVLFGKKMHGEWRAIVELDRGGRVLYLTSRLKEIPPE
jgi:hypothetical protein